MNDRNVGGGVKQDPDVPTTKEDNCNKVNVVTANPSEDPNARPHDQFRRRHENDPVSR